MGEVIVHICHQMSGLHNHQLSEKEMKEILQLNRLTKEFNIKSSLMEPANSHLKRGKLATI